MRLVARYRLTWLGASVEPGAPLEARGAAQEKRLYGLWLRRAAITESAWQQAKLNRRKKAEKAAAAVAETTAPVAEPSPRPAAVGRRPGQPR